MPHTRQHQEGADDRRRQYRREDDYAAATIAERAVEVTPLVSKLLHTGKVAGAMLAIGGLLGMSANMIGVRIGSRDDAARLAQRVDTNSSRIGHMSVRQDSLVLILMDMRNTLKDVSHLQCIQARRRDPDLRPDGCDGNSLPDPKTP